MYIDAIGDVLRGVERGPLPTATRTGQILPGMRDLITKMQRRTFYSLNNSEKYSY